MHYYIKSRYTLAVSNTLMDLSVKTNPFFPNKGNGGLRFTHLSWQINHYSGMAAGNVTMKYRWPNVTITPTTTTTNPTMTGPTCMGQAADSESHVSLHQRLFDKNHLKPAHDLWWESGEVSVILFKLLQFPSTFLSKLSNKKKTFMKTHLQTQLI